MTTTTDADPPERDESLSSSGVTISANHGATAIGRVGQLNMLDPGSTVIGNVDNLNVVLPAADKTATAVLPIAALPADGTRFVGRSLHRDELVAFLTAARQPCMALLVGAPGIGKTALARESAITATAERDFAAALFVDLYGYAQKQTDRVQAADLYGPLLRGLDVPAVQIPDAAADRATLYHQVLDRRAAEGAAVLLWLDNVGDRGQIEGLVPADQLHRVVVTTREMFPRNDNHVIISLDLLPVDEAVELLTAAVGEGDPRLAQDPESLQRVAQLCDRLPLALRIMAALMADEPDRPISAFADDLEAETHRLDNLHYDDRLSVRAAFSLSYRRLPKHHQRLFRLVSQVPGADVSLDAARWLTDASASAVRPRLQALVRAHLIQQHLPNRWTMHDLVRLYATELATTDPEDAERAFNSVVEHYRFVISMAFEWLTAVASERTRQVFSSPAHAAAWFEIEKATAIAIVKHIASRRGYEEICLNFGVALGDLLRSQAHWRKDFHDIAAVTASVARRVPPQWVAGSALSNFGTSLGMQHKYDEARRSLDDAVEMYESIGDPDRASGARGNIANLLQAQERYNEAIALYREDLKQCPPSTHPHPAANSLSNLGGILAKAGRPGEGVTQLLRAVVLYRELDDRSGLATALLNLGGTYLELAQTVRRTAVTSARKAVQSLDESYRISKALRDKKGQADAANNLGVALYMLRQFDASVRFLREAVKYYEDSGQDDQAGRTRLQLQDSVLAATTTGHK
jgi:tetratricopeptide (TPR) repeat protein